MQPKERERGAFWASERLSHWLHTTLLIPRLFKNSWEKRSSGPISKRRETASAIDLQSPYLTFHQLFFYSWKYQADQIASATRAPDDDGYDCLFIFIYLLIILFYKTFFLPNMKSKIVVNFLGSGFRHHQWPLITFFFVCCCWLAYAFYTN